MTYNVYKSINARDQSTRADTEVETERKNYTVVDYTVYKLTNGRIS